VRILSKTDVPQQFGRVPADLALSGVRGFAFAPAAIPTRRYVTCTALTFLVIWGGPQASVGHLLSMRLSLWKISVPSKSAFAQRPSSVSRLPIAGSVLFSIAHTQLDTLGLE
jgi:hypothetical protein